MAHNISFLDFDDTQKFSDLYAKVKDPSSENFVLEFDEPHASCAFDLRHTDITELLSHRKAQHDSGLKQPTRWINIWKPERQRETIKAIARHYGFSPRLMSSMMCSPVTPVNAGSKTSQHRTLHEVLQRAPKKSKHSPDLNETLPNGDPENIPMSKGPTYSSDTIDLNHYRIVDEVWHFASVDWGFRFTCIGFNSLHSPQGASWSSAQLESDKPAGKRVWTWLVLCNDGTVISIHENVLAHTDRPDDKLLFAIRHNMTNVFRQLSRATVEGQGHNPIMTVNIRPGLHQLEGEDIQISDDSVPSLLFYYLFDDWFATYALVSRKEHQYGKRLEAVRLGMFVSPDIDNTRQLHHLGRQLAVLKRVYQSYTMIIDRLLKGPQSGRQISSAFVSRSSTANNDLHFSRNQTSYGVLMSTAAAVRFERLRDRIDLYAMSEIQDCLDEKEDLVMLNFNLVTLKESSYIERLTRITILLAKVTILFLPVSLMSAYFAIPLVDYGDSYTLTDYWAAFAVVLGLSMALLVAFGYVSGTAEGKPIYRSLTRVSYEVTRRFLSKDRDRKQQKDA